MHRRGAAVCRDDLRNIKDGIGPSRADTIDHSDTYAWHVRTHRTMTAPRRTARGSRDQARRRGRDRHAAGHVPRTVVDSRDLHAPGLITQAPRSPAEIGEEHN